MCGGIVKEVVYLFIYFLIVSVSFANAIDPMESSIVESIART